VEVLHSYSEGRTSHLHCRRAKRADGCMESLCKSIKETLHSYNGGRKFFTACADYERDRVAFREVAQ
jgi:hypothetical protein